MFLSIGMLKLNYFLADIFILSAEKQPIKLSWRKIEWLQLLWQILQRGNKRHKIAKHPLLKDFDSPFDYHVPLY